MKLIAIRSSNFRSIEDSKEFEVGDLTCLVGKNEAGKTALLQAVYGLNPMGIFEYDKIRDYPRRYLTKFDERHPDGESIVVNTRWKLGTDELALIAERLGPKSLTSDLVEYSNGIGYSAVRVGVDIDEKACVDFLIGKYKLNATEKSALKDISTTKVLASTLEALDSRTEKQNALLSDVKAMRNQSAKLAAIDILSQHRPKFFYTSHFDRMSGEIALNKLAADIQNKQVSVGDKIFLDFLEYAGTSLEELKSASKYEHLTAQCEGASNDITDEIFEFWSQNEALSVKIELSEGKPGDNPPFNSGTIALIRIKNENHRVSVPLSERSAGFIWFFSFLAQFKQLKKSSGNAILLLDEPGLTLHGKAQADLLRYIQERLLPEHQVIYTTHSPFMVPAERLADVRVVEDVVERKGNKVFVQGTKVSKDILSVDSETLFPLQGHLGYEITQSLFVGKNTLLVEGPSDILYLQAFSNALTKRNREGLDSRWTVCPTGGIDKVWSFASLFGGNKLNIAVLCDYGIGDKATVERLRKCEILQSSQVFTASDFSKKTESDIEDLMTEELYASILNYAFDLPDSAKLSSDSLNHARSGKIRIVKAAEDAFRLMPAEIREFNHFIPADWLIRNTTLLDGDHPMIEDSLNKFEAVFKALNALIRPSNVSSSPEERFAGKFPAPSLVSSS